jgi:hypothetical protein
MNIYLSSETSAKARFQLSLQKEGHSARRLNSTGEKQRERKNLLRQIFDFAEKFLRQRTGVRLMCAQQKERKPPRFFTFDKCAQSE